MKVGCKTWCTALSMWWRGFRHMLDHAGWWYCAQGEFFEGEAARHSIEGGVVPSGEMYKSQSLL